MAHPATRPRLDGYDAGPSEDFRTRLKTAVLERGLLNRVAADQGSELRGSVRFDGVAPISPGAARASDEGPRLRRRDRARQRGDRHAARHRHRWAVVGSDDPALSTMSCPDVDLRRDGEHHPAVCDGRSNTSRPTPSWTSVSRTSPARLRDTAGASVHVPAPPRHDADELPTSGPARSSASGTAQEQPDEYHGDGHRRAMGVGPHRQVRRVVPGNVWTESARHFEGVTGAPNVAAWGVEDRWPRIARARWR